MASPVAQETITLNTGELKHTIIKVLLTSINHHYYLTALQTKFAIPMIRKHNEAELTIMYHNYMTSANKNRTTYPYRDAFSSIINKSCNTS